MSKQASLAKLKKVWDKKLKDSGFRDIEYNGGFIEVAFSQSKDFKDPLLREAKQDYYYMAYHFLNDYKFNSELDKVIWEYHAEGISVREIADLLAKAKISKIKKTTIWETIKQLELIMKQKYLST